MANINNIARKEAAVPPPTPNTILNMFLPGRMKYAPNWVRNMIGGDEDKQAAWAGNLTQAAVYAALLASIGYGSRKLLRGTTSEAQDALNAIDKYVPSSDDDPYAVDTTRLIDKDKYKSPTDKAKAAIKRVFSFKNASNDDVNALGYLLPPGAAIMGWMVGQKLAEKEIQHTTLSDSKARLAKARADYNRVLAKKLNPDSKIKEKVIQDRMQNPLDWGIEKGIEAKDKLVAGTKKALFGKQAGEDWNLISDEEKRKELGQTILQNEGNWYGRFLDAVLRTSGFTPGFVAAGAMALLASGKYGWNNYRATDKNLQKALDKEAAIKRRAQEANDQRLDLNAIMPEDKTKKKPEQAYGGAMDFSF